jgi:hypothetical protein
MRGLAYGSQHSVGAVIEQMYGSAESVRFAAAESKPDVLARARRKSFAPPAHAEIPGSNASTTPPELPIPAGKSDVFLSYAVRVSESP